MGLMDKICESDPKDKYSNVRHATFMASQNWCGEDLYRLAENGHVVVRQELGRDDDRVRWLTANKWTEGYEADCPFKDGLMILITDKAGSVIATESTYHTEWNGGGLADKELPFSWEEVEDSGNEEPAAEGSAG